VIELVVS